MTTKKFIIKNVVAILIFLIALILISSALQSLNTIALNYTALGQMQNTDEAFVWMNTYKNIRTIANISMVAVSALFVYTIVRDTYKFIKTNYNTKKGEN